jgi:hypothetical protein
VHACGLIEARRRTAAAEAAFVVCGSIVFRGALRCRRGAGEGLDVLACGVEDLERDLAGGGFRQVVVDGGTGARVGGRRWVVRDGIAAATSSARGTDG